jgi:hypothetical protein
MRGVSNKIPERYRLQKESGDLKKLVVVNNIDYAS